MLADAEIVRRREADGDAFAVEPRLDHASQRLERKRLAPVEMALGKPGEAACAVAAHLPLAAVAVKKIPAQVGVTLGQAQQQHAVRADAALAVADFLDLLRRELEAKLAIVDHHEIVPGSVHFCEVNQHAHSLPKLGQASKRAGAYR